MCAPPDSAPSQIGPCAPVPRASPTQRNTAAAPYPQLYDDTPGAPYPLILDYDEDPRWPRETGSAMLRRALSAAPLRS